ILESRNDRADRPRLPRRKGARRAVRDITQLASRRLYLPLQPLADRTRACEGAGNGGTRHAYGLGNIGDPDLLRSFAIALGPFDFRRRARHSTNSASRRSPTVRAASHEDASRRAGPGPAPHSIRPASPSNSWL